jgi:hypothetical protein
MPCLQVSRGSVAHVGGSWQSRKRRGPSCIRCVSRGCKDICRRQNLAPCTLPASDGCRDADMSAKQVMWRRMLRST